MNAKLMSQIDLRKVRRNVLLLIIMIFALTLKSFSKSSELSLKMFDNSLFMLEIDGAQYGQSFEHNISSLVPGNHHVRVFKSFGRHGCRLFFDNMVYFPPSTKIFAKIAPDRRFKVVQEVVLERYHEPRSDHPRREDDHQEHYFRNNRAMSPAQFSDLRMAMINTAFDDSKLNIAKQALAYNVLTSDQVLDLMKTLNFETARLEFAKYAYQNVVDKHNFFIVNNAFHFSSSIDDLTNYVRANS